MERILKFKWRPERVALRFIGCGLLFAVSACGGGGGGGSSAPAATAPPPTTTTPPTTPTTPPPTAAASDFDQGVFRPMALFKDICLAPRTSTPGNNFPDRQGTAEDENYWLRSWSNELYLWYDEIIDEDPQDFTTPNYFDLMRTFAVTESGADRDQFHFTIDTEEWLALSQSGVSAGYGARIILLSASVPREAVIAYVDAGSPAANAGLTRGTRIVEVDGVSLVNAADQAGVDVLNAGIFPSAVGETHTFVVEDLQSNQRSVTLASAQIVQDTVPVTTVVNTSAGAVGYILFNSHIAPAEQALVNAIQNLSNAGVAELVLDLRYNGGGFLDIANELAFMIAGPGAAAGRTFEESQFNDKHPTINPVTGAVLGPSAFHQVAQGFSVTQGTPLPSLNLSRVFVLSGEQTCSASESIINGLRGIDVEVVLLGNPTCGKPYGFFATDNCGTTYFSVQFRGINAKGFGDYADGFVPSQMPSLPSEVLGCTVADDFSSALGDISEARFASAINFIETGSCPLNATAEAQATKSVSLQAERSAAQAGGIRLTVPQQMPGKISK